MSIIGNEDTFAHARRLKSQLAAEMYGAAVAEMAAADDPGQSYLASIPWDSNVVGFGYGMKWTGDSISEERAVRVYVRAKLPVSKLSPNERIPQEIDGVPTDVIEIGYITTAARPTGCGVSGANQLVDTGTLGCLVQRAGGGTFILSNNHVLADLTGPVGVPILEPGRINGGSSNPPIANLTDFHPIDLRGGMNEIDVAIAELTISTDMTPDIVDIGRVSPGPMLPVIGQGVTKRGATTLRRVGVVDDLDADITVPYPPHGNGHFHHQFTVQGAGSRFANRGDSGSLVLDSVSRRPVGLLFAISDRVAFCNYIGKVLTQFGGLAIL
jgi:hypothetical protein